MSEFVVVLSLEFRVSPRLSLIRRPTKPALGALGMESSGGPRPYADEVQVVAFRGLGGGHLSPIGRGPGPRRIPGPMCTTVHS
jgi:hypothetical protein